MVTKAKAEETQRERKQSVKISQTKTGEERKQCAEGCHHDQTQDNRMQMMMMRQMSRIMAGVPVVPPANYNDSEEKGSH